MTAEVICQSRDTGKACQAEGTVHAEGMCVHEHLLIGVLCERHIRKAAAGEMRCPDCHLAGHECAAPLLTQVPS